MAACGKIKGLPVFVSIVIPARNAADVLGDQLEALCGQDYKGAWEIIVVDNLSTDATPVIARLWSERISSLRIVSASDRLGANYARNVGATSACGNILLFCDADDVASPGWLNAMASSLRVADIVGGFLEKELLNADSLWRPSPEGNEDHLPVAMGFLPYADGSTLGVWSSVYHTLGGFNESYAGGADEIEFCWRAQLANYTIIYAPGAVMHRRLRSDRWSIIKQAFGYGYGGVRLYSEFYHHGITRQDWPTVLKRWAHLICTIHHLFSAKRARHWLLLAGSFSGRIVGSIRNRAIWL